MGGFFLFPLAAMFIVVVLPIWLIAHYTTRWRTTKTMSSGDEKLLTELWDSLGKMEDRVRTLERILDEEAPDWRTRT